MAEADTARDKLVISVSNSTYWCCNKKIIKCLTVVFRELRLSPAMPFSDRVNTYAPYQIPATYQGNIPLQESAFRCVAPSWSSNVAGALSTWLS